MEETYPAGESADEISIDRCRELLGDEADNLRDEEVDQIRRHAETMARVVVEMFLEMKRTIH